MDSIDDEIWMRMALAQAEAAAAADEVPVGAVLISGESAILSMAANQTLRRCDPTAHAEIIALREAAEKVHNYRLLGTVLYATVEPCVMCMWAMLHARVSRIVFGAPDPKWGAAGSMYDFASDSRFNHRIHVTGGVCADECRRLMQDFFRRRR